MCFMLAQIASGIVVASGRVASVIAREESRSFSAAEMTRSIIATASTGNRPTADSADSITASAPRYTADKIARTKVGQFVILPVTPDILHRIEFRCVHTI